MDKQLESGKNQKRDGWRVGGLADAYADRPPIEWIAYPYFERPSVNIVYGRPGGHKTNVVLDLAVHVATGQPWMPAPPVGSKLPAGATPIDIPKARRVLLVDQDNGQRRTQDRLKMFGRGVNAPSDAPVRYVSMPTPMLDLSQGMTGAGVIELIGVIIAEQPEVLIIDTLATVTGGAAENSADMSPIMVTLRQLAERYNLTVIVIHHERKHQKGDDARAGEGLRGHSSIEAGVDNAYLVSLTTADNQADNITVTATKSRGKRPTDITAAAVFAEKNGETTAAGFYGITGGKELTYNTQCFIVYELIKSLGERAIQTELVNALHNQKGMGVDPAKALLKRMVEENKIAIRKLENKNASLYYIP